MSSIVRQRVAVAAGVRTFSREPTNVVLLFVLPPLVLFAFELALALIAEVPGIDVGPGAAELGGALFATAFLAGLLGVFQVVGAAESDRRLVVCGYRPTEILLARVLTILLAGSLVAIITFTTFLVQTDVAPEATALALGALVLAAILYGLLGVTVGAVIGRELEGSLVLVFLADFDSFNAVDVVPTDARLLEYLPLATPHDLLETAVYDGTLSVGDLSFVLAYCLVLALVAVGAVSWRGGVE